MFQRLRDAQARWRGDDSEYEFRTTLSRRKATRLTGAGWEMLSANPTMMNGTHAGYTYALRRARSRPIR